MIKNKSLNIFTLKTIGIVLALFIMCAFLPMLPKSDNVVNASNLLTVTNSSFQNGETTGKNAALSPKSWTASVSVNDEDAFYVAGRVNGQTENTFNANYTTLKDSWIQNFKDKHADDYESEKELNEAVNSKLPTDPTYPGISAELENSDQYVLMLVSKDNIYYSFTSSTTTANVFGYYRANVYVKTIGEDTHASISILGIEGAEDFTNINTNSDWVCYSIYFATRSESSIQIKLSLGNGENDKSSGTVFFDAVSLEKLTFPEYEEYTSEINANEKIAVNNRNQDVLRLNDTNKLTLTSEDDEHNTQEIVDEHYKIGRDNTEGSATYKLTPGFDMSIPAFKFYRESVWIKSDTVNSGIKIEITSNAKNTPSKAYSTTITNTTKDTWQEYVIYIKGNSYTSTTIEVKITIENTGSHEIYCFTNEKITAAEYSAVSGNKLELNTDDSSAIITNGYFTSFVSVDEHASTYYPTSWTYKATGYKYLIDGTLTDINVSDVELVENETITYNAKVFTYNSASGTYINGNEKISVIKNMVFVFDSESLTLYNSTYKCYADNFSANIEHSNDLPAIDTEDVSNVELRKTRNCLKIDTTADGNGSIVSPQITISSNTDYFISFSLHLAKNKSISVSLVDSSTNILTSANINGTKDLTEYRIYIRGGETSKSVTLLFNFDNENSPTQMYLANVGLFYSSTFDSNAIKKTSELGNYFIVDLSDNGFYSHTYNEVEPSIYESTSFDSENLSNSGSYGIINTADDSTYKETYGDKLTSLNKETNTRVLIIKNDAGEKTVITQKYNYTLSSSSYYVVTVYTKTILVKDGTDFSIIFSASNGETDINQKFEKIDTTELKNADNNGYQKYVLYIATGDNAFSNFNVSFSLNGEGVVLVDSITETTSSKSNMTSATEDEFTKKLDLTSIEEESSESTTKTEDTETEEEPEEKDSNTLMIFFIVFSSLLLVAAIVIAIVFIGAKRLPHRKRVKYSKKQTNPRNGRGFI